MIYTTEDTNRWSIGQSFEIKRELLVASRIGGSRIPRKRDRVVTFILRQTRSNYRYGTCVRTTKQVRELSVDVCELKYIYRDEKGTQMQSFTCRQAVSVVAARGAARLLLPANFFRHSLSFSLLSALQLSQSYYSGEYFKIGL